MKHKGDPWAELDNFPEPELAPDFAHQVLRQAKVYRRRHQLRRRLVAIWVLSATLGFAATTLIRARPGQKNAQLHREGAASGPSGAVMENPFKVSGRLAEGLSKSGVAESTSHSSSTLVIEAPAHNVQIVAGAVDVTTPQIAPLTTPHRLPLMQPAVRPNTFPPTQPAIRLP